MPRCNHIRARGEKHRLLSAEFGHEHLAVGAYNLRIEFVALARCGNSHYCGSRQRESYKLTLALAAFKRFAEHNAVIHPVGRCRSHVYNRALRLDVYRRSGGDFVHMHFGQVYCAVSENAGIAHRPHSRADGVVQKAIALLVLRVVVEQFGVCIERRIIYFTSLILTAVCNFLLPVLHLGSRVAVVAGVIHIVVALYTDIAALAAVFGNGLTAVVVVCLAEQIRLRPYGMHDARLCVLAAHGNVVVVEVDVCVPHKGNTRLAVVPPIVMHRNVVLQRSF